MKLTEEEAERLWNAVDNWRFKWTGEKIRDRKQDEALVAIHEEIRAAHEPKSIWYCEKHNHAKDQDSATYFTDCYVVEYIPKSEVER